MVELIRHSQVYREDIALGNVTQEVLLADDRVVTLRQIHFGSLLLEAVTTMTPSAAVQLSVPGVLLKGARVLGVTVAVLSALGTSNSLTTFDVGYQHSVDQWGRGIAITEGTETSQEDFPIIDDLVFRAADNVLLTATAGTFDTTGLIEVKSHFFYLTHN